MEPHHKEIIKRLLLAPIHVDKELNPRRTGENKWEPKVSVEPVEDYEYAGPYTCIVSSQKYYSTPDPDMCDFTVGFYECIYRGILPEQEKKVLKDDGYFSNACFAGDTMNSFNTAANALGTIGKSRKEREKDGEHFNRAEWPEYAREYLQHYHCLANFWLLPIELGRKNPPKDSCGDYMDCFLGRVVSEFKDPENSSLRARYPKYFEIFKDLDDFIEKHAIACYFDESGFVIEPAETACERESAEAFFKTYALEMIGKRADLLTQQHGAELWEYFTSLGLTESSQVDRLEDFPGLPFKD